MKHCSHAPYFLSLSTWQIFVGKIPRDLFEDELVPLFEKAGPIWDLRLMMDPLSGLNRGYAFVTFCTKEAAQQAVKLVRLHYCKYDPKERRESGSAGIAT